MAIEIIGYMCMGWVTADIVFYFTSDKSDRKMEHDLALRFYGQKGLVALLVGAAVGYGAYAYKNKKPGSDSGSQI